ncbi:MAG: hypothetical protein HW397_409 [Dehalococcoidia bacterium]|nr:hypothetical protein [Dehalococcoidia bacterium]
MDGEKVYDRTDPEAKDFYPSLAHIRGVRSDLLRKLEAGVKVAH